MTKIQFKVSARAGKLIGRENFSNPGGAIIELVKNSYDADANECIVIFDIPTKSVAKFDEIEHYSPIPEESVIYIIDNGEGMTEDIIKDHWMKIGTGNKEADYISDGNRTKTGAKGIGRFALDRLGYETELWTLPKNNVNNEGAFWKMDWNQFDEADKSISEITAELISEKIDLNSKAKELTFKNEKIEKILKDLEFKNGTFIKISNLKDFWFDEDISGVFKSLEALIPPRELEIPFSVYFHHFQRQKEYGKVETAYFNDFDYKLEASYDSSKLKVDFKITRNELDIKQLKKQFPDVYYGVSKPYDLNTIENKEFEYSKSIDKILKWKLNYANRKLLEDVGNFELTFYYLKFSNSIKEGYPFKTVVASERKSTLERFGGVKIYRDSFRVRPYGDPTNDWLRLGARVAQSPAGAGQRIGDWRVRPEQTAGIITISRKDNPLLIDKSDRGSLQENDSFETFKKIIVAVIHEFEVDRTRVLNPIFLKMKKEKAAKREKEIERRAQELADVLIEKSKEVDTLYPGKNQLGIFQDKKEKEERKAFENAFIDTFIAINDERDQKESQEVVQVRSLASLGLIVSSFAHELKEIRDNAVEAKELEDIFNSLIPEDKKQISSYKNGINIIKLLDENSDKVVHWVNYALTAIRKDKRHRTKFDFTLFFNSLEKSWNRIFKKKDVSFHIINKLQNELYNFRAFEMDMTTIFTNLINNSIDSFNSLSEIRERNITIESRLKDGFIEIVYSDDGKGLDTTFEDDRDEIFLPFTTSKKDRKGNEIGTGLGMYLVKSVIDDNNGSINILDVEEGFSVLITFPIRNN